MARIGPMALARKKGWAAAKAGQKVEDCPYKDSRCPGDNVSFSGAWKNAWIKGFEAYVQKHRDGQGGGHV